MRSLVAVCLNIVLCPLSVLAVPHGNLNTPSTYDISVEEASVPDGLQAIKNAISKFGTARSPAHVARAATATTTGTVTANPVEYDAYYLSPVAIGSPANTYQLSIDTGSSTTSVYAPKLGTSGTITTVVNVGGISVARQAVTLNNDQSGGSNILGMSYQAPSFYANAVNQNLITAVYTANLNKGAPGKYTLGYIDSTAYTGSITYSAVSTANGFWQINSNGYSIGSGSFVSLAMTPIVDTGTSLLLLPQSLVTTYYKQVIGAVYNNAQGGYIFPCSTMLPNLVLGVGSYRATVPGSYLNFAPIASGSSTCFGGLQSDSSVGVSIFGLPLIKSQYVVFKGTTNPSVGFAKKA